MRLITTIVPHDNLRHVPDAARALEEQGFHGIVTPENKHDAYLPLGVASTVTEKVQLGTCIALSFVRSPMVTAMLAWDIQNASNGRFVLGLATQVKGHNERRYSVPWSAPAPRMKEYIQSLRAIWKCWKTGEPLNYVGKHYQFTLMTPNFTPEPMEAPTPPVTMGAIGPAMLRVAGEVCDGVRLHPFCTKSYLQNVVMPELTVGMERGGRVREQFEITGSISIVTGKDDAAVAEAFEWARYRTAFYSSTPAYWPVLEHHGLEDMGHKLNKMSKENQWDKMAAEVPDDVVHLFAAVGRHDEIVGNIRDKFDGCDTIYTVMHNTSPEALPSDLIQEIGKLPTVFQGYPQQDV